jgi:hypothetical protein
MEEKSIIMQDIATKAAPYSTDGKIEVCVTHVINVPPSVVETVATSNSNMHTSAQIKVDSTPNTDLKIQEGGELKESFVGRARRRSFFNKSIPRESPYRKKETLNQEVQTDEIDLYKEKEIDLMDRATGSDREIPTYSTKAVMADLRHPIEDVHDQLQVEYVSLQGENERIKRDALKMISKLQEDFNNQIESQTSNSEVILIMLNLVTNRKIRVCAHRIAKRK